GDLVISAGGQSGANEAPDPFPGAAIPGRSVRFAAPDAHGGSSRPGDSSSAPSRRRANDARRRADVADRHRNGSLDRRRHAGRGRDAGSLRDGPSLRGYGRRRLALNQSLVQGDRPEKLRIAIAYQDKLLELDGEGTALLAEIDL